MTLADGFWALFFLLVAAGSVRASRMLFGTWLSPLSIFLGMNSLSLFGYHLRQIQMNDVSLLTHLVVLGGFAAFTGGVLLGCDRRKTQPKEEGRSLSTAGLGPFFYGTAFLSTIGWMVGAWIMVGKFGLGGLVRNIWLLQENFQQQFVGYLNLLGVLVVPAFTVRALSGTRRFWDPLLAASSLFGLLLAGIKSYTVYSLLAAILVWGVLRPQTFRVRYLVGVLAVLLIFFVVYTSQVDIFTSDHFVMEGALEHVPALGRPWLYFTGPWPAMENIIDGTAPPPPLPGTATLQPLWKLLGDGLGIVEPIPPVLPFTSIGLVDFNVYSFVGEVYWDWKFPGVLLFSFMLGLISTRLYLRARSLSYWGHLLVYGVVGYGLFLSCFMYTFRFNLVFILVYLYAAGFFLVRGGVFVREDSVQEDGDG